MKLPHGVNPAHVASKDATRYVLNGVKFGHGLAVATNGRMLVGTVATREDDDADREAIVPTRAMIKAFPKAKGKRRSSLIPRLVINPIDENDTKAKFGTVTITDKEFDQTTVKEIDGNYPAFEEVFTDHSKATLKVGINAAYLAMIAKALGDEQLVLHFDPDGFKENGDVRRGYSPAIYVTAGSDREQESVAIIMPVRVSGDGLDGNRVLREIAKIKAEKAAAAELREAMAKMEAEAAADESQTTNPTE